MIFQVPYNRPVDVVQLRARNVTRVHVRAEVPVRMPEHPKDHLQFAASVEDTKTNKSFGIMRDPDGVLYMQTMRIAPPLMPNLPDELPPVRRIVRDWQEETEAKIAADAARMVYSNGTLHRPIPEPYVSIEVSYYGARTVVHTDGLEFPGFHPTFRLDQTEEIEAAYAEAVERQRNKHTDFQSHPARIFCNDRMRCHYDPEPMSIVYAATQLVELVQNVVGKLPTEQIMSWVTLRDLIEDQRTSGRIDVDALGQQLVATYDDLRRTPNLQRYDAGKNVRAIVDDIARPRTAQALSDLSFGV